MPPRRSNKGLSVKPTKTESPFPYGRVCVAWLGKKSESPMQVLFFVQTDVWWAKEEDFMT